MTRMQIRRGKRSVACGALLSAAALLFAAPASADPTDDAFIAALDKNGIPTPDSGSAISKGRGVCAGLDKGQDSSLVVMRLMKETNLSAKQAGFFVGVSVASYCPQYKGTLDPSMIWLLPFPPMM
jgi:Protein of unknown function (DUF732)